MRLSSIARVSAFQQTGRLLTQAITRFEVNPKRPISHLGIITDERGQSIEIEVVMRPADLPRPTALLAGPKEPA